MSKPNHFSQFKDYRVTLHNRQKRHMFMIVRKCRSAAAAIRAANLLIRMNIHMNGTQWNGTDAYELTTDGKVIWT